MNPRPQAPGAKPPYAELLSALQAERARSQVLEEALKKADAALMDARNGLDLGLGCARDLEGDKQPVPEKPRSVRQDRYLRRARLAHREVKQALSLGLPDEEGEGRHGD